MFFALMFGLTIGAGVSQFRFRKNLGEALLAATIDKHFSRPHLLLNNVTLATPEAPPKLTMCLSRTPASSSLRPNITPGGFLAIRRNASGHRRFTGKNPASKIRFTRTTATSRRYNRYLICRHNIFIPSWCHRRRRVQNRTWPNVLRLGNLIPFLTAERPALFDERKMTYIIGRIEMKRERRSVETDEYQLTTFVTGTVARHQNRGCRLLFGLYPKCPPLRVMKNINRRHDSHHAESE